tara:strand:+ start:5828 stop:7639 length:1812 start_codon:yes stop_codon:yes gene_type:complete
MASKFGYVERDSESQVNWSDVSKGFSDMLLDEKKDRGDREQARSDFREVVSNTQIPLGQNTTWNEMFTEFSDGQLKPFVYATEKAWRVGKISTGDYNLRMQRVSSQTDGTIDMMQNLNAQYAKLMASASDKDNPMSVYAQQNLDNLNRFTNLNDTALVIQENGNVVGNKLISDGAGGFVNSTKPEDITSMQAMGNIFLQDVKEYDVDGKLNDIAEEMGVYEYVFSTIATKSEAGSVFKIEDITALESNGVVDSEILAEGKKFLEAENTYIEGIMSDPLQAVSVLMDFVGTDPKSGKKYENCEPGEDCTDSYKVKQYYTENGRMMPVLSEDQINLAKEKIKDVFRSKLDRKVTATNTGRIKPTKPTPDKEKKNFSATNISDNMMHIWWGDKSQIDQAAIGLRGLNPDIKELKRTATGVKITYYSGGIEENALNFYDSSGNMLSQKDWLVKAANYFLRSNEQAAIKEGTLKILNSYNYDLTKKLSKEKTTSRGKSSMDAVLEDINADNSDAIGTTSDYSAEANMKAHIKNRLETFVGGVDNIFLYNGNKLRFNMKKNAEVLDLIPKYDAPSIAANMKTFRKYLEDNLDEAKAKKISQQDRIGEYD